MVIPALAGLLPVKNTGVHGALESRLGRVELECRVGQPRLFEMELGLVRIVLPLGQFTGMVAVGHADGMVVAHPTVAAQDGFHQLLTIHGVFEGQPYVFVVVWGRVGTHGKGEVLKAVLAHHLDAGHALEQVHGLEVTAIHDVDLTGLECIGTGINVVDAQYFNFVEPGAVGLEVVGVAGAECAHTRFKILDYVGTRKHPLGKVRVLGSDDQVIVAQGIGEIGIAALHFESDGVFVLFFHADDGLDQRLGCGFGALLCGAS